VTAIFVMRSQELLALLKDKKRNLFNGIGGLHEKKNV
jgi:hypothetical protein